MTINLRETTFYDGAKRQASTAAAPGITMHPVAVGNDGFVLIVGEMTTLWFKKGSAALKVSIYAKRSADALEAMELALAKQAAQAL